MDFKIGWSIARRGRSRFTGHVDSGWIHTRIQSGIGTHYNVRVQTSKPLIFASRWTKIDDNLWVNNGSALKRLGLKPMELTAANIQGRLNKATYGSSRAREIPKADPNHPAITEAIRHKTLFTHEKVQYLPVRSENRLQAVYQLNRKLGTGAGGTVWSATDLISGQRKAIKTFQTRNDGHREHSKYDMIGSTSTVQLHKKSGSLIMEQMDGDLLDALIRGVFDQKQLRQVLKDVWDQLGKIHKGGAAHRDIKLQNILYKILENGKVKIVIIDPDFAVKEKSPPKGFSGTPFVVREQDRDWFQTDMKQENPEKRVSMAKGADLFALVVESLQLVAGTRNYAKNGAFHTGESPCTKEQFVAGFGSGGERIWNLLDGARKASLEKLSSQWAQRLYAI